MKQDLQDRPGLGDVGDPAQSAAAVQARGDVDAEHTEQLAVTRRSAQVTGGDGQALVIQR